MFEKTTAGIVTLGFIQAARGIGNRMELRYVFVYPPDQAVDCTRNCIALPGYDIPKSHVRRRLARSRAQLPAAIARSDLAGLHGSANPDEPRFEVAILRFYCPVCVGLRDAGRARQSRLSANDVYTATLDPPQPIRTGMCPEMDRRAVP